MYVFTYVHIYVNIFQYNSGTPIEKQPNFLYIYDLLSRKKYRGGKIIKLHL